MDDLPLFQPVHHFVFFTARKNANTKPQLHMQRDAEAALQMNAALVENGFLLKDSVLNYPPDKEPSLSYRERFPVDLKGIAKGSFLLQTTRPPIHDRERGDTRRVERGYTDLEERVFEVFRRYLLTSSRQLMVLQPAIANRLPAKYSNRSEMRFYTNRRTKKRTGVEYQKLLREDPNCAPHQGRTAAFFLRVDEAWEGGPGLLAAFGMDGITTLAWAYRLGHDFSWMLRKEGFAVVEMNTLQPGRETRMFWADELDIQVIFHSND